MFTRPAASEYAPYYEKYISLVPDGDILETLRSEFSTTLALLNTISEEASLHRYAPGKWSVREAILHVSDTERIFAYRALRFARGDKTELAGFEQDGYVKHSSADARSWQSILDEFTAVRQSSIELFHNLPPEAWTRSGIASGHPITVLALAYLIPGHEIHHRDILRQRYR